MLTEEKENTQASTVVFKAHNHIRSKAAELVLIMISSKGEYNSSTITISETLLGSTDQ